MPVAHCYICEHNHPRDASEWGPSYDDCARCTRPTCQRHGRAIDGDHFYCIRCLREIGRG